MANLHEPLRYYKNNLEEYPAVLQSIAERIRIFICGIFYTEEPYEESAYRYILSDLDAGEDQAIRSSVQAFKDSNTKFPFTAWNFGDNETKNSVLAPNTTLSKYFSTIHNCYIYTRPMKIYFPMMSFFSHPSDFIDARTKLTKYNSQLTRLDVPILINNIQSSFNIDLHFDIKKGKYAHAFSQYLVVNHIYDLSHTLTVDYYDIIVDTNNIHPIDNMILNLNSSNCPGVINSSPGILSYNPTNNSTAVAITSSIIITFQTTMNESKCESGILVYPEQEVQFVWNGDGTILTIVPVFEWVAHTQYEITFMASTLQAFANTEFINRFENITYKFKTA